MILHGWMINAGIKTMLECWPQWNSPSDVRKAEFHGVKIKELRNLGIKEFRG